MAEAHWLRGKARKGDKRYTGTMSRHLEDVFEEDRRKLVRTRLEQAFETGLAAVGDLTWTRDDLYDRALPDFMNTA